MNSSPLLCAAALCIALSFYDKAAAEELPFSPELWQEIRRQKEEYSFETKSFEKIAEEAKKEEVKQPETSPALLPRAAFDIDLPADSGGELSVSGRKSITMKFGKVFYKEHDASKRTVSAGGTDGFDMDMDQQLQIKIKGKVGRKIDVDINYDDNQGDLNRRNIQIKYTGDPDEIVQKVEFGDITLSLPGTEFVGYSGKAGLDKNLFGFMGSAKYKDLSLYFVGSQTKGRNEIKRFTGSTEFRKPTINDAGYLSRRYYKLYNSTASLPLTRGSVEIWMDDRIGDNNLVGITQPMTVTWATQTFNGHFDLLKPGVDYVVDHSRGIVTFYRSIAKDAIIACDWKDALGNSLSSYNAGYKTVIKDDGARSGRSAPDEDHYELKNRYSLGATNIIRDAAEEKFVVRILDNSNSETAAGGTAYVNFSSAALSVDYDLGIIEFVSERPFEGIGAELGEDYSSIYDPSYQGERRHFAIYSEYRVKLNTYLLRPSIVKDSERITLDGRVLDKDRDYMLDYYSGWITFLNTENIKDDSAIEASYEYYPFIGGQEQTLAGTRLEYKPSSNFFLGGTMLYNFAPSAGETPSIYHTSPSTLLLDVNTALTINPKRDFPFRINVSGEAARSDNDPNRAGKAIIENMENIKQVDSISIHERRWQPLSIQDPNKRGMLVWSEIAGINMRDLNPSYYTDKDDTSALALNYSLMPLGGQTALVQPISNAGADYSLKKYIEGYIWGSGKNETLIIELGRFNEDADGNGILDTEDTNSDGFLNAGEDTGVKFNYPGSDDVWFTWGADNGNLDSEDLDGDGVLSTDENIIYSTAVTVSWSGWRKFKYELPITADNRSAWRAVKQIGLTIGRASGGAASGELKVSNIGIVGNRWQKPVALRNSVEIDLDADADYFDVSAINNESDPEYAGKSLLYTPYYSSLYDISDLETREQALRINYSLSPNATAYTYASYSRMDLSIYKTLNFFVYGENSGNLAFIRLGNDRTNYYEHSFSDDFSGWKAFSISLLDEDYDALPDGFQSQTGSVNLNNITRIFFGLKSGETASSGELWFNDIYVSGVKKETGSAKKAQASVELPGWFTVSGSIRDIDAEFRSMTFDSSNDHELKTGDISFNRLRWMPLSGHIEKSVITTPRDKVNLSEAPMAQYLSTWDEGRIEKDLYSVKGALNIRNLPQFSGDYSHSVTSNTLAGKTDTAETVRGRVTYELPNLIILPKNISTDYSRSVTLVEYTSQISNVDTENKTETFGGDARFFPFKALNFNSNYKLTRNISGRKIGEDSMERLLNSQNAAAGVSGNLRPFSWLNASFNYSAAVTENYALPAGTEAWKSVGLTLKDVNRTGTAGFGLPLNMANLINFGPTNNLNFNYSLKVTDADVYKNVDKDFKAMNKLFLRDGSFAYSGLTFDENNPEAALHSYSTSRSDTLSSSYKPFSFLNLSGAWTPLGTTDINLNYTSNLARTELTGTPSETQTLTFPDARIRISSLEQIPLFGQDFSAMNTLIEIYNSETEQKNISLNSTERRGMTLNLKWRKFTIGGGFRVSETENMNLQQNVVAGTGKDMSWNTSVNFDPWQKWHSNLNYTGANNAGYSAGGIMSRDERSHGVSGKLYSDTMKMRKSIQMPFSSKTMEIDQNVRYNIDCSGTMKRSSLNVANTNFQLYTGNFSMDFDMSSNFRWSLGGGLTYADYTKRRENNYLAIHISTKLEIIF